MRETTFPIFSRKDTSRIRLKECSALSDFGLNPYATSACVSHPLVIGLYSISDDFVFPFVCDVLIALWLLSMHGLSAAGLYLLHPLVAAAPVFGGGFHQLTLLSTVTCAGLLMRDRKTVSALALALTTALSPYSVVLLFPGFRRFGKLIIAETVAYFIVITSIGLCATQSLDFLEIYSRQISRFPDPRPSAGLWWAIGSQQFEAVGFIMSLLGIILIAATAIPLCVIFEISRFQVLSVFWLYLLIGPASTVQDLILLSSSLLGECNSLAPDFSDEAKRWVHCALGAVWLFVPACWHWLGSNAGNFNFLLAPSLIVQVFLAFGIGTFIRGWK